LKAVQLFKEVPEGLKAARKKLDGVVVRLLKVRGGWGGGGGGGVKRVKKPWETLSSVPCRGSSESFPGHYVSKGDSLRTLKKLWGSLFCWASGTGKGTRSGFRFMI